MVLDALENLKAYLPALGNLPVEKWIEEWKGKPVGRYEADDGSGIYGMVQEGSTKPLDQGRFEAHRRYVDVQVLLDGEDLVQWNLLDNLSPTADYNSEKDVAFYTGEGPAFAARPGWFYIMLPWDGHKPNCHLEKQGAYRKLVLKVPVEGLPK